MEAGALFHIHNESHLWVDKLMEAIKLRKDKVGGYAYDDAQILITQIKLGLEQDIFE